MFSSQLFDIVLLWERALHFLFLRLWSRDFYFFLGDNFVLRSYQLVENIYLFEKLFFTVLPLPFQLFMQDDFLAL